MCVCVCVTFRSYVLPYYYMIYLKVGNENFCVMVKSFISLWTRLIISFS